MCNGTQTRYSRGRELADDCDGLPLVDV